ncbi:MAG: hypothetical protein QXH03_08510 [Candidatus Bathyarchaeia archaeon]
MMAIGGASFSASGMALEVCAHQPDQAFSVQPGIGFHLVQKAAAFLTVGPLIPLLHPAQVLIPFFNRHPFLRIHLTLR